jgi:ribonucleoside-diphosphate reductase alpha chain
MGTEPSLADISYYIWDTKYRFRDVGQAGDAGLDDTWRRVARALASVEQSAQEDWQRRFYDALKDFRFLPGGRIQAGAGTGHRVTLFNCFVMGTIEDSMEGIFDALKEAALTMQQGGGVGFDFSTLRPAGEAAKSVGTVASGPLSFMRIWDSMCATILSTGARRGAMMATLRCDHPDIEAFVEAKHDASQLRHFNLSVLVSDAFMDAVRGNQDWPLVFPLGEDDSADGEICQRVWAGSPELRPCRVVRRISARALWDKIMRATYDYAEPGVIFIDRINRLNNLWYCEQISATNPCGEIPLPPYGACDLGSINLTSFVRGTPFTPQATLDMQAIRKVTAVAVRMLDNVYDLSLFPLPQQAETARRSRRLGLGITGLGDALAMLDVRYGSEASFAVAENAMREICHSAYRTSVALAREKGVFPDFDAARYGQGQFIQTLPEDIQSDIQQFGIRNSHLISIAPTGTISLLANNVSSGLEPIYEYHYLRRLRILSGGFDEYPVADYAYRLFRASHGEQVPLPEAFVRAGEIVPEAHLKMQAALQPYVDNAISKTVNVPVDVDFKVFSSLYESAFEMGLKGCTTFRPNPVTGQILLAAEAETTGKPCCAVDPQ